MKRRSFIQKTALGTAGMMTAFHIPSMAQNRKINIGLIGCGWYGLVISTAALKTDNVRVVAVCDVDSLHLKEGADEIEKLQGARPREYKDYRDLLDVKALDAVMIGTPPQWHALQFIAACEKGLDIYCEKPLAYDVEEGKAMMKAAWKAGNIVQIGFQRRQSKAFGEARTLIEEGTIGKVHHIGAQIHYTPGLKDHTIQEPPASLDWDAWCGPAPKLPYRPIIGHHSWRLEKEYGNGHLVDWGIHNIDIIRKIMGFGMPDAFQTLGGINVHKGKITTPDTLHATMNFEACPVVWEHRLWGTGDLDTSVNNGVFFYGEKATLFASDNRLVMMPAGKNQQQKTTELTSSEMQDNHVAEFVNAVKARDKNFLSCEIEDAFQSTATVQLAMASYYSNSPVKWDTSRQTIVGNKEAAKLMARPYRKGYERPTV